MKTTPASRIAFGGIMAAVAVVIMNLVGLIPIATYVCPALCMIVLAVVLKLCGKRVAWAWYGAVAILSLLFSPDREASAIFLVLGYYPIVKGVLERTALTKILKYIFFNLIVVFSYWLLINLMGLTEIAKEFSELGLVLTGVMLLMGNMIFAMLDRILTRITFMDIRGRK